MFIDCVKFSSMSADTKPSRGCEVKTDDEIIDEITTALANKMDPRDRRDKVTRLLSDLWHQAPEEIGQDVEYILAFGLGGGSRVNEVSTRPLGQSAFAGESTVGEGTLHLDSATRQQIEIANEIVVNKIV